MGLPSLSFDAQRLDSIELIPFRAGIAAGAGAVMTAHIALPRIDPSGRPATLSEPIINGILRRKLGFQGMVVTDGMRMQGITDKFSASEATVNAIEAGVDLILGPADMESAFQGLVSAVQTGRISGDRIDASVRRILLAKERLGLGRSRTVDVDSIFTRVGKAEFQKKAEEISNASVVLLRNEGNLLPLPKESRLQILAVTEDPGWVVGTDLLNEATPLFASVNLTRVSNETGSERFQEISTALKDCDVVVVGVYLTIAAWKGGHQFSKPLADFLASLSRLSKPVVLVAFGDPYVLGKLPETAAVMTPMNGTLLAEKSVARAIGGRIEIKGKLPVTLPGRYLRGSGVLLTPRK